MLCILPSAVNVGLAMCRRHCAKRVAKATGVAILRSGVRFLLLLECFSRGNVKSLVGSRGLLRGVHNCVQ